MKYYTAMIMNHLQLYKTTGIESHMIKKSFITFCLV